MKDYYDLAVVGGGIVGLSVAYKYQRAHPDHRVVVLEKEAQLSKHQTGRNSGVIHSGIYYRPGSYKARTCTDGRRQLVAFAREHNIPHDICGKLILATHEAELPLLDKIYQRGLENQIEGIEIIDSAAIQETEPHARGLRAIRVPVTGIIDYKAVCEKLAAQVQELQPQSEVLLNTTVLGPSGNEGDYLETSRGKIKTGKVVYCAGLQSDRMAGREGIKKMPRIVGFRGDYYELTERGRHKVKNLIYPVPDPDFPFLGVHFTRMTDGSVECGPNAVFSFKREGYSKTSFDWRDTWDALSFSGTWKLFSRHMAQGWAEYRRAFSKRLFLQALRKMIPDLSMEDIRPVRSGVRAQALEADGKLVDDFSIRVRGNSVHVINAPSPAATAALAIADEILRQLPD